MQGIVIINAYVRGEKFIRQGERVAQELCALGLQTKVVRNGEIYAALASDGSVSHNFEGISFAVYLDKDKYLGRALEKAGVRLFNRAEAVENCDDKLTTYLTLAQAGVRLAKSVAAPLCYTQGAKVSDVFLRSVEGELGFPTVAKKSYGSFGAGVRLVRSYQELLAVEEEWLHAPHFYQECISESFGRDIRVIVIGGKAVAAMERVAQNGEFRSNVELGGRGKRVDLTEEYRAAAERCAAAMGLDYCGVDLLEGKEGAIVCEVNSNAFFEGIEEATGKNIARLYAEYIAQELGELAQPDEVDEPTKK